MIVERGSRHIGFWDEKEGAIAVWDEGRKRDRAYSNNLIWNYLTQEVLSHKFLYDVPPDE